MSVKYITVILHHTIHCDFIFQKQFGKKKQRYQQGTQAKEKQLRQLRQKVKELRVSCLLLFLC